MISPLSRLQMIYILTLFQMIKVFCDDTIQIYDWRRTLEHTFGYDFIDPPEVGTVLIWKISGNSEPFITLQYNEEDTLFGPEDTYLLFTQKAEEKFIIYYWLGRNTPLKDKKVAAKYAIILTQASKVMHIYNFTWAIIARETEGMESCSFHNTMEMFNKNADLNMPQDKFTEYLDKNLLSPQPNLYVLQGDQYYRVKKIPLSMGLQWLMNKYACLILEREHKFKCGQRINYICGAEVKNKQIIKSWLLTNYIHNNSMDKWPNYDVLIENKKTLSDFKQFLEVLEDSRFYNHNEKDYSDDHLKSATEFVIHRDEEISLFDLTRDGLKENTKSISSSICKGDSMGYLLDSKSAAGVFAVLVAPEHINMTLKGIQLAEEYLDETYPLSLGQVVKMRIIYLNQDYSIIDFQLNFSKKCDLSEDLSDGSSEDDMQ